MTQFQKDIVIDLIKAKIDMLNSMDYDQDIHEHLLMEYYDAWDAIEEMENA